MSEAV